jgi:hypothetical protein
MFNIELNIPAAKRPREIIHRDSLGSLQAITPGAVNWMTAGRDRSSTAASFTDKQLAIFIREVFT